MGLERLEFLKKREKNMKKQSVYSIIADDILKKIQDGTYPIGSFLPPEREFMSIYGVQRTTVRRGLDILSKLGYIKKVAGLGSLVKSKTEVTENLSEEDINASSSDYVREQKKENAIMILPSEDEYPTLLLKLAKELENAKVALLKGHSNSKTGVKKLCLAKEGSETLGHDTCFALLQNDDFRSVVLDSDKSAFYALTYLESLGHTNFAYIGTDSALEFENAFYASFSVVNSAFDENLVRLDAKDEKQAYDSFITLYKEHGASFTAVCTPNDDIARGVIKSARKLGVKVPENLSVISLCSSEKTSEIDGVYFDIYSLSKEIEQSLACTDRICTVLFGGTLRKGTTCATFPSGEKGEKSMSDFLL